MHTLIQTIFSDGERFPLLVNEDGVPDFWVTLFTSQTLRDQTQSSITSCLSSIRHLYKWEKINNQNIIDNFRQSLVPGAWFVESIKNHCGLKSEHIEIKLSLKPNKKIVSFKQLKLAKTSALCQVSCDYQQRRMYDISAFLMFVGSVILKNKHNSKVLMAELNDLAKAIELSYPKSRFNRNNKRLPHAEKVVFEKFLEVFKPDSEQNPFKGYDLKLRNYLLVQLLFWTGARSGEILSLTIDDIDYDLNSPKVKINRRHDDFADSRKYQPVTKTNPRDIIIPIWLRNEIDHYINKIRSQYPNSKKHPYIFVSHKGLSEGQPITNTTFYNRVIVPARATNIDCFRLVKRHGFRHLFNEILSEKIDTHNEKIHQQIAEAILNKIPKKVAELRKNLISDQQEIEMRMSLMGHSSEKSSLPYLERHLIKQSQKFHKEMMQDMSAIMKNARGA